MRLQQTEVIIDLKELRPFLPLFFNDEKLMVRILVAKLSQARLVGKELRPAIREYLEQLVQAAKPAAVSEGQLRQNESPTAPPAPLDRHLRHQLQVLAPVLYVQVLEPTLADLRQEHSEALAEGRPVKARWVLLRGCGALLSAAVCQLSFFLLGRIAGIWHFRSPK